MRDQTHVLPQPSGRDDPQAAGTAVYATRYVGLNRRQARLVLATLCLALAGCLAVSLGPAPKISTGTGQRDVDLNYAVAQRVRAGQGFYDAMGGELRARGYPLRSVFNWRTPLHLELIAHLPSPDWARILLLLGAACAIGLNVAAMCRDKHNALAGVQLLLLSMPLAITAMPHSYLFAEVWSGVLITMSVGLYALGWRPAGASAGLLALFFRELALPYALIGAFLACREKRRLELCLWLAGIGCYGIHLGLHAMEVAARIPPAGVASMMTSSGPVWRGGIPADHQPDGPLAGLSFLGGGAVSSTGRARFGGLAQPGGVARSGNRGRLPAGIQCGGKADHELLLGGHVHSPAGSRRDLGSAGLP